MKKKNHPKRTTKILILFLLTLLIVLPLTAPAQTQAATLKAPKPAVKLANNYLQVSWNKVSGAKGYVVYAKTSKSAAWKSVKTVSASTLKYNYRSVTSGKQYFFTVRAYQVVGGKKVLGSYNKAGVSSYYLLQPYPYTNKITHNSVILKWRKVIGVSEFQVFRKTQNEGYTKIANVRGLTYTDDSLTPNTKYTYMVRSCKGSSYKNGKPINVTTYKIPINEAIDSKVYVNDNNRLKSFIELYNKTEVAYYSISGQIVFFDQFGNIVYKEKMSSLPYIKSNQTKYSYFVTPSVSYSYYRVTLTEANSSGNQSTIKNETMVDITINNNTATITNTTENLLNISGEIIYFKNGVPIYRRSLLLDKLNVYQSHNESLNLAVPVEYDEVKIQLNSVWIA